MIDRDERGIMFRCAFCDSRETIDKYFVCPGYIYRPNMYSTCDKHKNLSLKYEDVYRDDSSPPITRHEDKAI